MNFKNNQTQMVGTKTNSLLALLCSLAFLVGAGLFFMFGSDILFIVAGLWGIGIWQMMKGLNSENPKFARIARIILAVEAPILLVLCGLSFASVFSMFGK